MALKILHTSDWHLGKKLYKLSRLPEQRQFLDWLSDTVIRENIDALIIAGDIFDTPHPPNEALTLYFRFLKELTEKSTCQIFIISGNHDSGKFLEGPGPFFKDHNIHVVGSLHDIEAGECKYTFNIKGRNGEEVELFLLPYFRSHEIFNLGRKLLPDSFEAVLGDDQAIIAILDELFRRSLQTSSNPRVLVAHHLFGAWEGIELAGSEQGLSLSGLNSIPLSFLKQYFDYVALGHIHKEQTVRTSAPMVYYPGSPIPFRFSETTVKKVALLSFEKSDSDTKFEHQALTVPCFRKLLTLACHENDYEEKLLQLISNQDFIEGEPEALLEVKMSLTSPRAAMADTIRELIKDYPIQLISYYSKITGEKEAVIDRSEWEHLTNTEELFKIFYRKTHPEAENIPEEILEDFHCLLEEAREMGPRGEE